MSQVVDLRIEADRRSMAHDDRANKGKFGGDAPGHGEGGIVGLLGAQDDLELAVGQAEDTPEILGEVGVNPLERPQDRDGYPLGRGRRRRHLDKGSLRPGLEQGEHETDGHHKGQDRFRRSHGSVRRESILGLGSAL